MSKQVDVRIFLSLLQVYSIYIHAWQWMSSQEH